MIEVPVDEQEGASDAHRSRNVIVTTLNATPRL
jgi:hypothetical protein